MKIGILTYHRTNNYGACLQAVATRLVLERWGYEAFYVDYWPSYHASLYKLFSFRNMRNLNWYGKMSYLLRAFSHVSEKRERIRNFNSFLNMYIVPYCRPVNEHFDIVLYGSDQIWRKQFALNNYNPVYFGSIKSLADKHVAFAASMGLLPNNPKDYETVKELVSNFDFISVREENLKGLLESMGYNVKSVLDPTLLISGEEWTKKLKIETRKIDPYVLVYYVSKPAFKIEDVYAFAKEKGMDVKIVCGGINNSKSDDMQNTADPITFLSLIKNASYIFITSFHGLAFSILFEREFYVSFSNNSNRAETLLNIVGLEKRLLPPNTKLVEQNPINYDMVNKKLGIARDKSIDILKSFLLQKD